MVGVGQRQILLQRLVDLSRADQQIDQLGAHRHIHRLQAQNPLVDSDRLARFLSDEVQISHDLVLGDRVLDPVALSKDLRQAKMEGHVGRRGLDPLVASLGRGSEGTSLQIFLAQGHGAEDRVRAR